MARPLSLLATMTVLLAATSTLSAQEHFRFCGGRNLIHAVIRVCSRSLPDELPAPPSEQTTIPETTTTRPATTTASFEDVDEYLSRLNALLELMYAADELDSVSNDVTGDDSDDRFASMLRADAMVRRRRVRRTVAARRFAGSMQRAKQVARKCCQGCSYEDIQSLC